MFKKLILCFFVAIQNLGFLCVFVDVPLKRKV